MNDHPIIVEKARVRFTALAKPELVQKYARYFKEGYDAYGLTEAELHDFVAEITAEYPGFSPGQVIELGERLFAEGKYEMGSLAILWLLKTKKQFDRATLSGLRSWFDNGVGNWAHSDVICSRLTPLLLEKGHAVLEDFSDWRNSPSRWTRRAVPVTLLALRKTASPEALLDFIEPMMGDTERVVHQGLGWFLRELWKLHPGSVEAFLFRFRETAARLIFQYATEKMTPEQKERFRRPGRKSR